MNDFAHYLEAKRTVDDRALDRRVLETLREQLAPITAPTVVDVGAGTAAGIERLLDWGVIARARYTAVEHNRDLLETARTRLARRTEAELDAELVASTLDQFAAESDNLERFDLVVAHALLDIVELTPAVGHLVSLARRGGLLYCPITFDGETIFEPAHEDDEDVLSRYHTSMAAIGDSKTGRKLVHAFAAQAVDVLEMGSSDWIVFPTNGSYQADEAFFLTCVVGMVERSVGERATGWASTRRQQIEHAQLVYIAHQVDCLAKKR